MLWIGRMLGVGIVAIGLLAGAHLVMEGSWPDAIGMLAIAVPFGVLPWLHPMGPWFLSLLAILGVGIGLYRGGWLVGSIVLVSAGVLFWIKRGPIGSFGAPNPDRLEEIEPDAVTRGALERVEEFSSEGFVPVGAYRIGPRSKSTASILLSPDARSYAAVTDIIWHVTSLFPDGRSLLTRNSSHGTYPHHFLVNPVSGGSPAELVESHHRALATLADHGHDPVTLEAKELVRVSIDREKDVVRWAKTEGRGRWKGAPTEPLWRDPDVLERIAGWRVPDRHLS